MGSNPLFDRHLADLDHPLLGKVSLLDKMDMGCLLRVRGLTMVVRLYTHRVGGMVIGYLLHKLMQRIDSGMVVVLIRAGCGLVGGGRGT